MPKFLEAKLKAEAAKQGKTGRAADRYVYGAMNNQGSMKGNKETAKGRRMDVKHKRDMKAGTAESGKVGNRYDALRRGQDHMAKLTSASRAAVPTKAFALPGRRYPIENRAHAANAKARVSQFGTPAEKATVNAKVAAKFPSMGTDSHGGLEMKTGSHSSHPGLTHKQGPHPSSHPGIGYK